MGQTATAITGAAIGTLFGNPQAGWLIGSVIGGVLFPQDGPNVSGPRLGDLSVTSSAYGAAIPFGYGTLRIAGNVIWAKDIEEVVQKQNAGGKGGAPGPTQESFTYFGTFAIGLSEGPVQDITRMWADGKLLYDKTADDDYISKNNLDFRFYPGSETQEPDSIILDDKGITNTPAFRGLCYIVFNRLPLADFGNRIPNITVELTFNADDQRNEQDVTLLSGGPTSISGSNVFPDIRRGYYYAQQSSITVGENYIRRIVSRTGLEDRQNIISGINFLSIKAVLPDGSIIANNGSSNSRPIMLIEPNSLTVTSTIGVSSPALSMGPNNFVALNNSSCSWIETGLGSFFLGASSSSIVIIAVRDGQLEYITDSDTSPNINVDASSVLATCAGFAGDTLGQCYVMEGPVYNVARSNNIKISKLQVDGAATYDNSNMVSTGVQVLGSFTFSPANLIPGETELRDVKGIVYDQSDDNIMIQAQAESDGKSYMLKISTTTGLILWRTEMQKDGISVPIRNEQAAMNHSVIQNGLYGQMSGTNSLSIRTSDGTPTFSANNWPTGYNTSTASWWDGGKNIHIGPAQGGGITKHRFFRGDGQDELLSNIVEDLCSRVGLTSSDIDVTELSSIEVPGYIISRQTTVRGALEQLSSVFFFDAVESDNILKFTLRENKSVSATIEADELSFLSGSSGGAQEYLRETRIQEVELPARYTITFIDRDNDHQQNAHSVRRIFVPDDFRNVQSQNEVNNPVPIVLRSDVAKQSADKFITSSWVERVSRSINTNWKYLFLDPNDVVDITIDDGSVIRSRITQQDVGLNLAVELDTISEEVAQYNSDVDSDGGDGPITQEFLADTITKTIVLCSPLLRDSDDVLRTNSRAYFFQGGFGSPGWNSGTLEKSNDGTIYNNVGGTTSEMTWGVATTVLGDTDLPFQTDNINTVTVFLSTNEDIGLSSVTTIELLNGANAFALIHPDGVRAEICQFKNATLNVDGSYTLDTLYRGRRGSENFTDIHVVGSTFLLLEPEKSGLIDLSLSEVNQQRFYRAGTSGSSLELATTFTKTSPANDLKPYSPVHLETDDLPGVDMTFNWVRRTRVGGDLVDVVSPVPLSEDTELYNFVILDGAGGNEINSYETTSPTFTYTVAQQNLDFPVTSFAPVTLTNPSFETGDTTGWTVTPPPSFAVLTTDGNISAAQDGTNFLSGEEAAATGTTATQDVDITSDAAIIDAGNFEVRVTGYVASSVGDVDTGQINVEWLDAGLSTISTSSGTPVDPTNTGTWTQIQETFVAPALARTARITLQGNFNAGSFTNVAWDNISFEKRDNSGLTELNVLVYQISGQVGRGFPSEELQVTI